MYARLLCDLHFTLTVEFTCVCNTIRNQKKQTNNLK